MIEECLLIGLPVFALGSCVSAVYTWWYYRLRKTNTQVTNRNIDAVTRLAESREATAIFIVPTTSQVMDMFNNSDNIASMNNTSDISMNCQRHLPPNYVAAAVADLPPSYEEAIQHLDS